MRVEVHSEASVTLIKGCLWWRRTAKMRWSGGHWEFEDGAGIPSSIHSTICAAQDRWRRARYKKSMDAHFVKSALPRARARSIR